MDQGVVKEASVSGTMFRGFEIFLKGRDPWDAQRLVQRVCGVCPAIHGVAAAQNLDAAFGITNLVPHNGRHIRNLILATNYLQSHILHFYVLAALDFVDLAAVADYAGDDADLKAVRQFLDRGAAAPFLPRYEGDYRLTKEQNVLLARHYVKALRMRALAHEAIALFAGKMPHDVGVVPGGVTAGPTADKILAYVTKIRAIREFIENAYLPDVLTVARAYPEYAEIGKGVENYLAWGAFDEDLHVDIARAPALFPRRRHPRRQAQPRRPAQGVRVREAFLVHRGLRPRARARPDRAGAGKAGGVLLAQEPALRRKGVRGRAAGADDDRVRRPETGSAGRRSTPCSRSSTRSRRR